MYEDCKKILQKEKMKKKYNPFKMWGSYVGALVGLTFGYLKTPCLRDSLLDTMELIEPEVSDFISEDAAMYKVRLKQISKRNLCISY